MQDRKSQKNFERALLHEMEKIKIAARQWHNNNTKGYRDYRSKEAYLQKFLGDSGAVHELKCAWRYCHACYSPKIIDYEETREY